MTQSIVMLVGLNPDRTDEVGNVYPETGRVVAKSYVRDRDIRHGLYGSIWGKHPANCYYLKLHAAIWVAVRVELDGNIIILDGDANIAKFRAGEIVYEGDEAGCHAFIAENYSNIQKAKSANIFGINLVPG
ncbi:MAG: hypothetical protein HC888_03410 [Candidatus Competibacteraceae bacterium]|nr:hypothetical protein [Candidatus Competibacteraceae bacterium]